MNRARPMATRLITEAMLLGLPKSIYYRFGGAAVRADEKRRFEAFGRLLLS